MIIELFPEDHEQDLGAKIEKLAEQEEMDIGDLISYALAFFEIIETDADAIGYFEVLAEKLGVSVDDVLNYFKNLEEDSLE